MYYVYTYVCTHACMYVYIIYNKRMHMYISMCIHKVYIFIPTHTVYEQLSHQAHVSPVLDHSFRQQRFVLSRLLNGN